MLGKIGWVIPSSGKGKPMCVISSAQAVVTISPLPHWLLCGTWLCHYTLGDLNWFLFDCHTKLLWKSARLMKNELWLSRTNPVVLILHLTSLIMLPFIETCFFYNNKKLVVSQKRIRKASHTSPESTLERSGTHVGVHLLLNLDKVCTTKIKCTSFNWPWYIPYSPFWEGRRRSLGSGRKRWHTECLAFRYLGAFFSCKSPSFLYNFIINIVAISVHFLIPLLFPVIFSYLALGSLPFVSLTRKVMGKGGRRRGRHRNFSET